MATQPSPPPPRNGNGHGSNNIGLRFGDKAFSLQSQNLVLLVLLAGVGFLSWERGKTTSTHLDQLQASQAHLGEIITAGQARMQDSLNEQNKQLDAQTQIIVKGMADHRLFVTEQIAQAQQRTAAQTETLRLYLLRHEFNADLPREQRLPLEIPWEPPETPKR